MIMPPLVVFIRLVEDIEDIRDAKLQGIAVAPIACSLRRCLAVLGIAVDRKNFITLQVLRT